MYIKEIVCADKEDSEADVIVSDGVYTIKCYMYPVTDVLVNQKINVIYAFECTDIMRVQSIKCNRRTPPDGFAEQNGRDAERAD